MTTNRRRLIAATTFVLTLFLCGAVLAGEPQDYVRAKQGDLNALLHQAASAERSRRVSALLDSMIDYDRIATDSLGRHAADRTEAELSEFNETLRKLVRRNYEKNIQKTVDYVTDYNDEQQNGDSAAVKTTVHPKDSSDSKDTVELEYRLQKRDGKWMVTDIITDHSSLVNNYKNQFNKTITKEGWPALIRKLKNKLNSK